MPARNCKKSKVEGLFKRCKHLSWEKCACPWWGRCKGHRVPLKKWAGTPIPNKEIAKKVLTRMEAAVLADTFDKRGERAAPLTSGITFSSFLDEYAKRHIEEDGLRSNSVDSYIEVFRNEFGEEKLSALAVDPYVFEKWLKDRQETKKWENATFNRYFEHGRAMFNWARARKLVAENPFDGFSPKPENNKRDVRVTPEQEKKLFEMCEQLDVPPVSKLTKITTEMVTEIRARAETGELQKDIAAALRVSRSLICEILNGRIHKPAATVLGREMKRRLIGAIDLGLREGEMLLLQVKHIDYDTQTVRLPSDITKAGKDQVAFVGTERLKTMLDERKSLGPEGYIFGRESGRYVASFDKTWRRLFALAGLPVGRKKGYVWHDLRHEYGSYLIEQGATIQEAKELMRHSDIRTTARYLKADDGRLRELAATMGKRLA
jgi:site-specific recombinase XerD